MGAGDKLTRRDAKRIADVWLDEIRGRAPQELLRDYAEGGSLHGEPVRAEDERTGKEYEYALSAQLDAAGEYLLVFVAVAPIGPTAPSRRRPLGWLTGPVALKHVLMPISERS